MLDLLARKDSGGDVCINLARRHLVNHEWGLARLAVKDGLARGRLTEPDVAQMLLDEVHDRLGIRHFPPVGSN